MLETVNVPVGYAIIEKSIYCLQIAKPPPTVANLMNIFIMIQS